MREKEKISTPLETCLRYGTHHEPLSHIIVLMYVEFPSEPFLTKSECQISQWCTRLFTIWIPITSPTASQPRLILATLLFYYYYSLFIFYFFLFLKQNWHISPADFTPAISSTWPAPHLRQSPSLSTPLRVATPSTCIIFLLCITFMHNIIIF